MLTWQKKQKRRLGGELPARGRDRRGRSRNFLQTGTMQTLSQNAKDALHHWRYEKAEEILPEGELSEPVVKTESTDTLLSVTADTAQTLYLRGFVGDSYENGVWSALDAETAAEEKTSLLAASVRLLSAKPVGFCCPADGQLPVRQRQCAESCRVQSVPLRAVHDSSGTRRLGEKQNSAVRA